MTDKKTTEEADRSPIDGSEYVRLATTGSNWKATLSDVFSSLGPFYNVQDYGWLPDGTDDSVAALALLDTVSAGGGGTLYFPASTGVYRADSQLLIPNDAATPQASQVNIRFMGDGGGPNWYAGIGNPNAAPGASILDLRYNSAGAPGGRITTTGLGTLMIDHLHIKDGGDPNSTPFLWTTNTVLIVENNAFVGNAKTSTVTITNASPAVVTWTSHGLTAGCAVVFTTSGALPTGLSINTVYYVISTGLATDTFQVSTTVGGSAVNTSSAGSGTHTARFIGPDGVRCGGDTFAVGDDIDDGFQGYGTSINHNSFQKMSGALLGGEMCNALDLSYNSFIHNQGLRAAEIKPLASGPITGLTFNYNIVEMDVYTWGFVLWGVRNSEFNNSFYDEGSNYLSDYVLKQSGGGFTTLRNYLSSILSGGTIYTQTGDATQLALNGYIGGGGATNPQGDGVASSQFAKGVEIDGSWAPSNNAAGALNIRDEFNPLNVLCLGMDGSAGIGHIDAHTGLGVNRKLRIGSRGGPTEIYGPLLYRPSTKALSNGANNNIDLYVAGDDTTKSSYVRITGPTGTFSISGFTNSIFGGGQAGSRLHIYNSTTQQMTITNDATSTTGNRILTLTGTDVTLRSGPSAASFIYDDTDARWILTSTN